MYNDATITAEEAISSMSKSRDEKREYERYFRVPKIIPEMLGADLTSHGRLK